MTRFQDLLIWQRSHRLAVLVLSSHELARTVAGRDVAAQLRRAVLSIPTNIAEGAGSASRAGFGRYIHIAIASAHETEALLLVARDCGTLGPDVVRPWLLETEELKRMLHAFARALRQHQRADGRKTGIGPSRQSDSGRSV